MVDPPRGMFIKCTKFNFNSSIFNILNTGHPQMVTLLKQAMCRSSEITNVRELVPPICKTTSRAVTFFHILWHRVTQGGLPNSTALIKPKYPLERFVTLSMGPKVPGIVTVTSIYYKGNSYDGLTIVWLSQSRRGRHQWNNDLGPQQARQLLVHFVIYFLNTFPGRETFKAQPLSYTL